ncbi:M28 family peptidase [Sphingobacterium sp. SGG-5]|uniref:M28 family peptidase n=1 Tax=Sphingobacterium sp. SGG-5 TaxID=2710881 RepID=UPI0013ED2DCC|nr:M28 family peptidase [Sphingobacterium sp. SGG-5]NGM62869.1 M28 family peptidase [Sphingobacterium sp. SGG-5]
MKPFLSLFFIVFLTNSCTLAQSPSRYVEELKEEPAKEHLTVLSSKSYEGRGTGQAGGQKAARYIADHFKDYGLIPIVKDSYFQPVALRRTSYKVNEFRISNIPLAYGREYFVQGDNTFQDFQAKEIVFIGYGIQDSKYNELKGIDIKGKVVLLLNEDEPMDGNGHSVITGKKYKSEWSVNRFKRIQALLKHKPQLILATGKMAQQIIQQGNNRNLLGRIQLDEGTVEPKDVSQEAPVVYITESIADEMLKQAQTSLQEFKNTVTSTLKPVISNIPLSLHARMGILSEKLHDPNVLGLIEGTDLKEEIIVVCAHYDHDGILPDSTYFPGADDNGSGTVAVLELARTFAQAKKEGHGPRRSILFVAWAAEERGLLGSKYYVENPVLPLRNTVACINIDMIGRIDDKHLNGNHNYIHVIGTNKLSTDLKPILQDANRTIQLELDDMYNNPKDPLRLYYRSDHYNFAQQGIPSLFFFSGLHPHYHTPEDTVDKIDFPMMVKREKLIFHVVWDIANRENRPRVDID